MNLELTGKLIEKYETQNVNERFKKREFVVELIENTPNSSYTNFAKLQLTQDKCELLDSYEIGEDIKVNFNIRGNRWEKEGRVNYITNLQAWRIEKLTNSAPNATQSTGNDTPPMPPTPPDFNAGEGDDGLPF